MNDPQELDTNSTSAEMPRLDELESAIRTAEKEASFPLASVALGRQTLFHAASKPSEAGSADSFQSWRDEVADDLLELFRQVQALAGQQSQFAAAIESLSHELKEAAAATHREVAQLRTDLLSQRRGAALHSIFETLIDPWQRLGMISEALLRTAPAGPSKTKGPASAEPTAEALRNQVQAAVSILGRALRELGLEEFTAQAGEPYDPKRMLCAGYMAGPPNVVLKSVKPGFCAGDFIITPAMVVIADPQTPSVIS